MATLNTTTFDYALKVRYSPKMVQQMAYKDNPWFARIRKEKNFGGKNLTFAVAYGTGPGRSVSFSEAQSQAGGAEGEDFALTRVKDYAVAKVDTETVLASEGNVNALLSAVETEMDRKLHSLVRSTAIAMFRDRTGEIGSITSLTTGVIVLSNPNDVTHFEKNQVLSAAADTSSAIRAGTGYVIEVDRDAGTITVSATAGGAAGDPTDWAANDELFNKGDYTDTSLLKIAGLSSWIPATAPTAGDSFFGVDRSSDATRLAGHRLSGSGKTIEQALYDVAVRIGREGGRPNLCYVSFEKYAALAMQLGTRKRYVNTKVANIAFEGIEIDGPKGKIEVYPDQNCPNATGWVLTESSWCMHSLRDVPFIIDLDGKKWLRMSDEDGIEIRMMVLGNMKTDAPGWNGFTTL